MSVALAYERDGLYYISFEIKDTGVGITDEAAKTLFKPFVSDSISDRKPSDGKTRSRALYFPYANVIKASVFMLRKRFVSLYHQSSYHAKTWLL